MSGFEVRQAADGATALEEALDGGYDLMLLDVMLPDIGGFEVARRLAAGDRPPAPPILFLPLPAPPVGLPPGAPRRPGPRGGWGAGRGRDIPKAVGPDAPRGGIGEILEQ